MAGLAYVVGEDKQFCLLADAARHRIGSAAKAYQKQLAGAATGYTISPQLTGPVLDLTVTAPGDGGTGFTLEPGSPLLGKSLDLLALFGINPGPVNYSGSPVTSSTLNVGAQ